MCMLKFQRHATLGTFAWRVLLDLCMHGTPVDPFSGRRCGLVQKTAWVGHEFVTATAAAEVIALPLEGRAGSSRLFVDLHAANWIICHSCFVLLATFSGESIRRRLCRRTCVPLQTLIQCSCLPLRVTGNVPDAAFCD